jgi:hypothetical protein
MSNSTTRNNLSDLSDGLLMGSICGYKYIKKSIKEQQLNSKESIIGEQSTTIEQQGTHNRRTIHNN